MESDAGGNKSVKIKITQTMSDFGSAVSTIVMKYADNNYIQYKLDFSTGQCIKDTEFRLPEEVLFDNTQSATTSSEPSDVSKQ